MSQSVTLALHGSEALDAPPRKRAAKRVLPGFNLTLGYTVFYLSLIVLIPLSALVIKTFSLTWPQFVEAVTAPRVLASYRLTFGASFLAALLNAFFDTTAYVGAVRDANDTWYAGWTCNSAYAPFDSTSNGRRACTSIPPTPAGMPIRAAVIALVFEAMDEAGVPVASLTAAAHRVVHHQGVAYSLFSDDRKERA